MEEPPMDISKRLRELRTAKKLSQGDIEKRTGLLRCYISRVENGHTVPSLETLERLAKALEVEVYQVFLEGEQKPEPIRASVTDALDRREGELLGLFRQADGADKQLLLDIARKMARRAA
jgi:transcriptional regulator with XRE-family HTH domain